MPALPTPSLQTMLHPLSTGEQMFHVFGLIAFFCLLAAAILAPVSFVVLFIGWLMRRRFPNREEEHRPDVSALSVNTASVPHGHR